MRSRQHGQFPSVAQFVSRTVFEKEGGQWDALANHAVLQKLHTFAPDEFPLQQGLEFEYVPPACVTVLTEVVPGDPEPLPECGGFDSWLAANGFAVLASARGDRVGGDLTTKFAVHLLVLDAGDDQHEVIEQALRDTCD